MRNPTDEEQVQRADNAWHDFRRVELYQGDPERETAMKDELVNYIPLLIGVAQRLLDERAALVEIARAVADDNGYVRTQCFLCGAYTLGWTNGMEHTTDCPVTKARALLEQK